MSGAQTPPELFGDELFGDGGAMRQGLLHGTRQEGWLAVVQAAGGGVPGGLGHRLPPERAPRFAL